MIVKLLPEQVSKYWEVIKYSAVTADMVPTDRVSDYCIRLLVDLLSEKAVCLVKIVNGNITKVLILSFLVDSVTNEKTMVVRSLYSFAKSSDSDWEEDSLKFYNFAKKNECTKITLSTNNSLMEKIVRGIGFHEEAKTFSLYL